MLIRVSVIIMEMNLSDMAAERIQPVGEGNAAEISLVAGIQAETEAKVFQSLEKIEEIVRIIFIDILQDQKASLFSCPLG